MVSTKRYIHNANQAAFDPIRWQQRLAWTATSAGAPTGLRACLPRERLRQTADHRQNVSGGEPEPIAREQYRDIGDRLRWNQLRTQEIPAPVILQLLLRGDAAAGSALPDELHEERSLDLVGVDRVHPDTISPKLDSGHPERLEQRRLASSVRHGVPAGHDRGLGDRGHDRPAESLASHDRGGAADRLDRAEVMDLELPLEIVAGDLADRSETRRKTGGVEETVQAAELEDSAAKQEVKAGVIPHVNRETDDASAGVRVRGHILRQLTIEIGHDDVGTLFGEAHRCRFSDTAAAADNQHDMTGQKLRRSLSSDLLLDLPPLQRPVLELEDVLLRNELKPVDRLGVADCLQHGAVADIRRGGAPLIAERGDHAEPGYENDLGPVVERSRPGPVVSPVIFLVLGMGSGELGPDLRGILCFAEDDWQAAGSQEVFRCGHAAADQLRHLSA